MSYDDSLQLLKRSFIGGGEGKFYFRMLDLLESVRHIDWLDIGIGNNESSIAPFAEYCRARGQSLAITGVDPDVIAGGRTDGAVQWTLVKVQYEQWTPTHPFDLINADQSLYYIQDLPAEIGRIVAALKPGGLLIATSWLQDDTLHRVRQRLFPHAPTDLFGEALQQALVDRCELEFVERAVFETQVDLSSFVDDKRRLEAAVRIIARGAPFPATNAWMRQAASILNEFPALAPRRNLAICFRRRA